MSSVSFPGGSSATCSKNPPPGSQVRSLSPPAKSAQPGSPHTEAGLEAAPEAGPGVAPGVGLEADPAVIIPEASTVIIPEASTAEIIPEASTACDRSVLAGS